MELGELVTSVSYQQVPLNRITTTFCLFPPTCCPTAIYIYQNMRLSEKNEVCQGDGGLPKIGIERII